MILLGVQTTLSWDVQNATDVSISGIGSVDPQSSIMVSPDRTTEYQLDKAFWSATTLARAVPGGTGPRGSPRGGSRLARISDWEAR